MKGQAVRKVSAAVVAVLVLIGGSAACSVRGTMRGGATADAAAAPDGESALPGASSTTSTRPTTTTTPAGPAKPADARSSSLLQGNASPPLPEGDPGKLAVVATGTVDSLGMLPVVVRNNTTSVAYDIEATGRALQGDRVVSSGESSSYPFVPAVVRPGEVAIGYLFFDPLVPTGSSTEVSATAKRQPDAYDPIPLEVSDLERGQGDKYEQIVGTVRSPLNHAMETAVSLLAVCFDEDGRPSVALEGYLESVRFAAGGTAPFAIDLFGERCPTYLVGASATDF